MARTLARGPVRLVRIEGGNKHNAIPRRRARQSPSRLVRLPSSRSWRRPLTIAQEISGIDPDLRIEVRPAEGASSASEASTKRLVRLLQALPHGALVMSRDIPGLVET